jgi:hypothetical protein
MTEQSTEQVRELMATLQQHWAQYVAESQHDAQEITLEDFGLYLEVLTHPHTEHTFTATVEETFDTSQRLHKRIRVDTLEGDGLDFFFYIDPDRRNDLVHALLNPIE